MRTSMMIAVVVSTYLASCTGTANDSLNAGSGADASADETYILSQDECDFQATEGISDVNCDAEFDKLVREIEADQNTGG